MSLAKSKPSVQPLMAMELVTAIDIDPMKPLPQSSVSAKVMVRPFPFVMVVGNCANVAAPRK
jgi:hypothetical protein